MDLEKLTQKAKRWTRLVQMLYKDLGVRSWLQAAEDWPTLVEAHELLEDLMVVLNGLRAGLVNDKALDALRAILADLRPVLERLEAEYEDYYGFLADDDDEDVSAQLAQITSMLSKGKMRQ